MFSLPECASFLESPLLFPDPTSKVCGVTIDSRLLLPGHFFIALKGVNTDGHLYVKAAMEKGASGALVEASSWAKMSPNSQADNVCWKNIIVVENSREALTRLAAWHRTHLNCPVAGITGSVGKTSAKDFLSYLAGKLCGPESILSTQKNFNNELGLPLTLLSLTEAHRFLVLEMGAAKIGDIRYLCDIASPTAAILTGISPSHIQSFGSLEAIYRAKLELFESLPEGSPAVIPDDDPILIQKASSLALNLKTVGLSAQADYRVHDILSDQTGVSFQFTREKKVWKFSFPSAAPFMALNAALALGTLDQTGFLLDDLPPVWDDFKLAPGRFSLHSLGNGMTLIFDGYNASPKSFKAALESLQDLASTQGRAICVAGDMLELGEDSAMYHEELGLAMGKSRKMVLFAYGPMMSHTARAAQKFSEMPVYHSLKADDIINPLIDYLQPGDVVLFKASRGMKVETIFERVKEAFTLKTQF